MNCCSSKQIIVETSNGTIRGSKMKSKQGKKIYAFRGIPYGKSPTGNLRFRRSEPCENWEGVRNCTKEAKKAYQPNVLSPESCFRDGGEDCLYLNVYTKVRKNKIKGAEQCSNEYSNIFLQILIFIFDSWQFSKPNIIRIFLYKYFRILVFKNHLKYLN